MKCASCNKWDYRLFSCDDCNFGIDRRCVALPKATQHWYDEHLLFLCYQKNKRGDYWCDICEEQIDTIIWFYTCDSCVTFHVKCVLGDFSRFMPGRIATYKWWRIKTMQTSPGFLPRCYICHTRRAVPFVLKRVVCVKESPVEETDSKSFSSAPRIEAKHITERSLYLSKMAASPIASPIAVAMYPTLSVFTLAIGLVITAFFFIYEATSSRKNRSLGIELATAALASVFLVWFLPSSSQLCNSCLKRNFLWDLDRCFCYLLVVFMSDPQYYSQLVSMNKTDYLVSVQLK
ncbi:hypothetical protein YC2023_000846 [Brassica napus]